jgi:gluconolactonase
MIGHDLRTIVDGLDHPEGVCWSPSDQVVYAGGEAGQLYRFPLEGGTPELVASVAGGFLLGLALDGLGAILACDMANHHVQRISPDGSVEVYGEEISVPNYPVFDSEGNLWVSDSGAWDNASGRLVKILPGGHTERVDTRLINFANGLAVRDNYVYVVESGVHSPAIARRPCGGGALEVLTELPGVVPDGLAFDEEGGLWIGCFQPNRVLRLATDGSLEVVIDDYSGEYFLTPTNLAFAGPDLDVLVMASLGGWAVRAIDPGVRGAPLHYPRVTE